MSHGSQCQHWLADGPAERELLNGEKARTESSPQNVTTSCLFRPMNVVNPPAAVHTDHRVARAIFVFIRAAKKKAVAIRRIANVIQS